MIKFQDGKEIYACEAGIEEMFMTKAFFPKYLQDHHVVNVPLKE